MTRSLLIAALMALTLTACGKKEEVPAPDAAAPAAEAPASPAPEAAPATPAPDAAGSAAPAPAGS